jgi:VWFA-related protein
MCRLALAVVLLCGVVLEAQTAPPTFRTVARLVVEAVTVTDRNGRPVEGLTAIDFIVTEDGRRQQVAFAEFQRIDAPDARDEAAATAPPPSLVTAIPESSGQSDPLPDLRHRHRRLLVLYFDLSAMPAVDQRRAFAGALRYVDTEMTPADLLAVTAFDGAAVRMRQPLTDDRAALREALQTLRDGNDANGDGMPDRPPEATSFGEGDAEFNVFSTDRQLAALQTAIGLVAPITEQVSLIYFNSGLRLNGIGNQAQLRATINAAVRANVLVSPVDARGLVAMPPLGDATERAPVGEALFSGAGLQSRITRFQQSQDMLYAIAKETGGQALFDNNDLSVGVSRAARAISSYYLVAYYTDNNAADGRFRRVRVSLAGGRAAELTYRQGYYANKAFAKFTAAEKERQLEEALRLDDPMTEVQLAVEVNYFQLNSAEYFVPVAVKMPGSELVLAGARGATRTLIDMIGEIKDEHGVTHRTVRDKLEIRLDETARKQWANRPIHYETGFTLLPGRYVIKLLARDATTGRIGTYLAPFVVPNLARETARVALSSVVLSSQRVPLADALYTAKRKAGEDAANPLVTGGELTMPSVTRVFGTSREIHAFLEAYQPDVTSPRSLVAFITIAQDDVKIWEGPPAHVTAPFSRRSKAVPIHLTVPPGALPAGTYECQVTVLDPGAGRAAFWRAPIAVVDASVR